MTLLNQTVLHRVEELLGSGFPLVPLGKGDDGKQPSVSRWQLSRLGASSVMGQMKKSGSTMYGVRLDGMVVLDLDQKDENLVRRLEARFGQATVHVETPRGFHLYYRVAGSPAPNLRKTDGMAVDVKSGAGHYVVGPKSIRPCGGLYTDKLGRLGITTLMPFIDAQFRGAAPPPDDLVRTGHNRVDAGKRHHYLVGRAVAEVALCGSADELTRFLLGVRDAECAHPSEVPDAEVRDVADWAVRLYRSGELTAASGGHFRTPRYYARALQPNTTASGLYALLRDLHGHLRERKFALNHAAMVEAGLTNLSERAFAEAVKKLRNVGAIEIAEKHQARKRHRQYRLVGPPV